MAEKDLTAKAFLAKKHIFADFVNTFIFKGRKLVKPKSIRILDKELSNIEEVRDGSVDGVMLTRDMARLCVACNTEIGTFVFICCMEFQSTQASDVVFRVMCYDALQYKAQLDAMRKKVRGKVFEVITIVINLSGKAWTQPTSIHEYFNIPPDSEFMHCPDYRICVFDLYGKDAEICDKFCTELKVVLNCFRFAKKSRKLLRLIIENADCILSKEARNMLNAYQKIKLPFKNKEAETKMCKGWDTLMRQMERKAERKAERKMIQKGVIKGKKMGERIGKKMGERIGKKDGIRIGTVNAYDNVVRRALHENTPIAMIQRLTGVSRRRISMIAASQKAD